jgi:hypothetical protein
MFNNALFAGGVVVLALGIPDVPTWVRVVVGIIMIVVGVFIK